MKRSFLGDWVMLCVNCYPLKRKQRLVKFIIQIVLCCWVLVLRVRIGVGLY